MWTRFDVFDIGGGDLIQMQTTATELGKLGVEVKLSNNINEDLTNFDIVHVFQMDWTPETYFYAKKAKKAGKFLVVSPIHHNVKEVKKFDDEYAFGVRKMIAKLFKEQHVRDTWKNIYRSFEDVRKLKPTLFSIFYGLKKMHIGTLTMADAVLVQTEQEAKDLLETYGVSLNWYKVPNGVGRQFIETAQYKNVLDMHGYILCVGRIEARKNNLRIIEAVEKIMKEDEVSLDLVFVGKKSKHHGAFMESFNKKLAENSWITHVPHTPWEEMPGLFHYAKVLVSASWFETSGLTILEALFSGTNAVAAGSRAKEILGDLVSYCDPNDVASIADAIRTQYNAPRPQVPPSMKTEYTWENAAMKTKNVYDKLIQGMNANN